MNRISIIVNPDTIGDNDFVIGRSGAKILSNALVNYSHTKSFDDEDLNSRDFIEELVNYLGNEQQKDKLGRGVINNIKVFINPYKSFLVNSTNFRNCICEKCKYYQDGRKECPSDRSAIYDCAKLAISDKEIFLKDTGVEVILDKEWLIQIYKTEVCKTCGRYSNLY